MNTLNIIKNQIQKESEESEDAKGSEKGGI